MFAASVDHKVKLKESEKGEKYVDLDKTEKKYGTCRWRWLPFVIGTLGTIPKALVREVEDFEIIGQVGKIQTTA